MCKILTININEENEVEEVKYLVTILSKQIESINLNGEKSKKIYKFLIEELKFEGKIQIDNFTKKEETIIYEKQEFILNYKCKINIKKEILQKDDKTIKKIFNSLIEVVNFSSPKINCFEKDLNFIHPVITPEIEKAVLEQLNETISIYNRNGIFEKFEDTFAKYNGRKYALVTSSGTAAIHSMFDAIGLKKGDEIICPIYTFFATISPVFQVGAKPVFVDCDETGNIDYTKIEEKINNKTKAIIVTHMWGYPCKMDKIKEITDKYKIYLLEDCSHAHGGEYKNIKLGSWGDMAAFSLQGKKIITGGEGGILLTDSRILYENSILFGQYNKRCKEEINKKREEYKYTVTGKGLKLRAHPIAIRIAYEMFKNLDEIIYVKNMMVDIIRNYIKDIEGIKLNTPYNESKCSYYVVIFKYNPKKFNNIPIEEFIKKLNEAGGIEFDKPGSTCPLNRLELFKNPKGLFDSYPNESLCEEKYINADNFYENSFKLPVWYRKEDVNKIFYYCEILKNVSNSIQKK